jgi:H+/Cl- antiporter ClcA
MTKKLILPALVGLASGFAVSLFMLSLEWVTTFHYLHPMTILGLPAIGFLVGWAHRYYGKSGITETGLILEEIHQPMKTLPAPFAPLVYASTLLSHLVGASAGREGAAVQISTAISDQLSRSKKVSEADRKEILILGLCSGFAGAIGTPWAAIIFGFELVRKKPIRPILVLQSAISVGIALMITRLLHVSHFEFNSFTIRPDAPLKLILKALLWTLIAIPFFVFIVRGFFMSTHGIKSALDRITLNPAYRGLMGGALLAGLFWIFPLQLFQGLGIGVIQDAMIASQVWTTPLFKMGLTALTLASGFKGGEFIPLFFMGATTGRLVDRYSGMESMLLPALGCVSVFGAAAKTPITCCVLAIELFGWKIAPFALVSVFLTYLLSGPRSLYHEKSTSIP